MSCFLWSIRRMGNQLKRSISPILFCYVKHHEDHELIVNLSDGVVWLFLSVVLKDFIPKTIDYKFMTINVYTAICLLINTTVFVQILFKFFQSSFIHGFCFGDKSSCKLCMDVVHLLRFYFSQFECVTLICMIILILIESCVARSQQRAIETSWSFPVCPISLWQSHNFYTIH